MKIGIFWRITHLRSYVHWNIHGARVKKMKISPLIMWNFTPDHNRTTKEIAPLENITLCPSPTTASPYMYTIIFSCWTKSGLIYEEDPLQSSSHHCICLWEKDKHRCCCFIVSIRACAGLQLHKQCLQSRWPTFYELTSMLPKNFYFHSYSIWC